MIILGVSFDLWGSGMNVGEIINFARYGELRQLAVKDDNNALLTYVNQALIELYKRFNLSIKIEVVRTLPVTKVYMLRSKDINQVLDVFDADNKKLRTKKTTADMDYDYTQINYNTYLFRDPKEEDVMFFYKAAPSLVSALGDDISIPYDMLEAMLNYIAYKAHSTLRTVSTDERFQDVSYYKKFEASCKELELRGYVVDLFGVMPDIRERGFI